MSSSVFMMMMVMMTVMMLLHFMSNSSADFGVTFYKLVKQPHPMKSCIAMPLKLDLSQSFEGFPEHFSKKSPRPMWGSLNFNYSMV